MIEGALCRGAFNRLPGRREVCTTSLIFTVTGLPGVEYREAGL